MPTGVTSNIVYSFTRDPGITVRVGPAGQIVDFMVYKSVLCRKSAFFKAALESDFKEHETSIIELPEDKPETFDDYFAWLYDTHSYTHSSPCKCLKVGSADAHATAAQARTVFDRMQRAWIFGDKVMDHDFCDMIIDAMLRHTTHIGRFPVGAAFEFYKICGPDIPAKKFLVDMFMYSGTVAWVDSVYMNEEGYKSVLRALMEKKAVVLSSGDAPWLADPCVYHWHKKEGGVCYKAKVDWTSKK